MDPIANVLFAFIACQIFWLNMQIGMLRNDLKASRSPQVIAESPAGGEHD